MLGEHEEVKAVVGQTELDAFPDGARVRVVGLVDVDHKAPGGEVTLFLVQPLGCCWVVGKNEASGDGYSNGNHAFDDEQPSPACDAHASVEVAEDTSSL